LAPTDSFRPNGFGLFDTAGNAAEWVEDCWNDNYRSAPKDASAWTSGDCRLRVLRGGNFTSKAVEIVPPRGFATMKTYAIMPMAFGFCAS
jgi:formylglycine-generating enzyme required for sulfatase activity